MVSYISQSSEYHHGKKNFQEELAETVVTIAPLSKSLAVLDRQKRAIEQDLEEVAEVQIDFLIFLLMLIPFSRDQK